MFSLVRLSFAPALGKLLIALLSGERKRAPEVLGWRGRSRGKSGARKRRNCGHGARSSLRLDGIPIKQSFTMKSKLKRDRFLGGAMGPGESRFETFEPGPALERASYAHFGPKLRMIFPLPSESSEPEDVRILLSEIQARLSKVSPGDS
jgi:hypothetical protein